MAPPAMLAQSDDRDVPLDLELEVGAGTAAVVSMRCPTSDGPNEDAAAVVEVDDRRAVLVVADGLGGRPSGEIASRVVVDTIRSRVARLAEGEGLRGAILDGIDEAGRRIAALGVGAGSTVAVVEIDGLRMRSYHVGDCEILAVGQRGRIKLQSLSHSPTAYAVESGLLDAAAALHHEDRHLITSVVGDAGMRIEIGSWLTLAPRDTLVLGTDGVFDNLHPREVADTVRTGSLREAKRRLSAACIRRMLHPGRHAPSKPDDLTFILYRPLRRPSSGLLMPLRSPNGSRAGHVGAG